MAYGQNNSAPARPSASQSQWQFHQLPFQCYIWSDITSAQIFHSIGWVREQISVKLSHRLINAKIFVTSMMDEEHNNEQNTSLNDELPTQTSRSSCTTSRNEDLEESLDFLEDASEV